MKRVIVFCVLTIFIAGLLPSPVLAGSGPPVPTEPYIDIDDTSWGDPDQAVGGGDEIIESEEYIYIDLYFIKIFLITKTANVSTDKTSKNQVDVDYENIAK